MSILSWYVARDFLRYLFLCLLSMVLLLLIANIFGNIESIFAGWREFREFLDSTVQSAPTILEIVLPMAVLLAVVMTFTGLSRTSELVAMKSAGFGTFKLTLPILAILVPVAALGYLNQNYLYNALHPEGDRGKKQLERNEWRSEGKNIYYFRKIDSRNRKVHDGFIFRWHSQPFRISEMVSFNMARRGRDDWNFRQVTTHRQEAGSWDFERSPRLKVPASEFPDVFKPFEIDAHHMPLFDLSRQIRQLENRSPLVVVYKLEWYQKIAALLAPFVMVLVGVPLSQSHAKRSRVAGEIVVTIFGGMIFWISNEIFLVLGRGDVIHPFFSAWGVNILFALLGLALMRRAR